MRCPEYATRATQSLFRPREGFIENPRWRSNSLQTEEQRVRNGPLRERASGAASIRPAELGVIANLGAKLVKPQTDKMSEKLDDMVGGVGDVRDSGETSAEEDVEDETRVEAARDALRRRPACHSSILSRLVSRMQCGISQ